MRQYETMFIINPDQKKDATEQLVDQITDIIADTAGEVLNIDQWGTKELAYEIDNYGAGYYTVVNFTGNSKTLERLEQAYQVNDDIIRYIILNDE